MYDVRVLARGGGWGTDLTTSSRRRALHRRDELRNPSRRRPAVVQVLDPDGRPVPKSEKAD